MSRVLVSGLNKVFLGGKLVDHGCFYSWCIRTTTILLAFPGDSVGELWFSNKARLTGGHGCDFCLNPLEDPGLGRKKPFFPVEFL